MDDHPLYREGLKRILDSHPRLRVVGEASSLTEALRMLRSVSIQILITDLNLLDGTGHQLLERAFTIRPGLRAVVVSVSRQGSDIVRAIQAGASAYLTKSASRDEVLQALEEVIQGRSFLHSEVSGAVVDAVQGLRLLEGAGLTAREQKVLELLCEGSSPKDISGELKMSLSTLRTHLRNIYRKMNVSSRTQLMLKVMGGTTS
ncbi:response regulator transcription factor [bacterium]|nr:response regulator transcription factor [bacterium]